MGNLLADPPNGKPAEPAPAPANDAAVQALIRENERLTEALTSRAGAPPAQDPPKRGPHPLERVSKEGFEKLDPMDQARTFDAAARHAARETVMPAVEEVERRVAAGMRSELDSFMLSSVLERNPDMAKDPEGMAAAMTRAQFRFNQAKQPFNSGALLTEAVRIYREGKPAPVYVEGASPGPAGGGGTLPNGQPKPKEKSLFEINYGAPAGAELHEEPYDQKSHLIEYIDRKVDFLEAKGFNPLEHSQVAEVLEQAQEREARKSAGTGA